MSKLGVMLNSIVTNPAATGIAYTEEDGKVPASSLPAASGGADLPEPSISRLVYVSKGGDDGTADGTIALPFLTVTAAMASIADNASAKRYSIEIGPGTFTEAGLVLKPFVYIKGNNHEWSTLIALNGGDLTLSSDYNAVGGRGGIDNIWFSSTGNIVLNLGALAGSGVRVISFNDCRVNNNFTFTPKTGSDALEFANVEIFGDTRFNGGAIYGDYLYVEGSLTFSAEATDLGFDMDSGACQTTVMYRCANGFSVIGGLSNFAIQSSLNGEKTGAGSAQCFADADSVPSDSNMFTGSVLTLVTMGNRVGFTPTTSGDWPDVPANVGQALDLLAARVAALE